jgi:hypothetical protein
MSAEPFKITESVVEPAALDWLRVLDYELLSAPAIAPGAPAANRPATVFRRPSVPCP